MTRDFGVASRRILQLVRVDEYIVQQYAMEIIPLIQLDLEGTSIGEHIVIRAHAREDSVHRAQPETPIVSLCSCSTN